MPRSTVEATVEAIEPDWTVIDAEPATGGHHLVTHVAVETPDGNRECVLKATPEGKEPMVDGEARMLSLFADETAIPVPRVIGVVDDHDDLPAPFALLTAMPGETVHRTEMDSLSGSTIEQVARSVGVYLGELHRLDVVDAFGPVTCRAARTLQGDRPETSPDRLQIVDPEPSWERYLRTSVDRLLSGFSEGRFADLVPEIEATIDERLDRLEGPHDPVLGHIDCSLENLLIEPETGEVMALLDWEFTLAVTAAYDLAFVEHSLEGGPWAMVPDAPDDGGIVEDALFDGYAENGSAAALDRFEAERDLYELLAHLHSMANFESWLKLNDADGETIAGAARGHREVLRELL